MIVAGMDHATAHDWVDYAQAIGGVGSFASP
jgi:hypothetical protein